MISIAFFILCHCVRKPGLLHPTQRISSIDMAIGDEGSTGDVET